MEENATRNLVDNSHPTDKWQMATNMFVGFCQISVLPLSASVTIGWGLISPYCQCLLGQCELDSYFS